MKTQPSSRYPWFKFYPKDFLAGTAHMTCEEAGIYIRFLCSQWEQGPLPADRTDNIAGRYKEPNSMSIVLKKFRKKKGVLINLRLEKSRADIEAFSKKQSNNASARWQCRGINLAHAKTMLVKQSNTESESNTKSNNNNSLIDGKNCSFKSLAIANRILANESGWHYDNCKVDLARLKASSLQTIIMPHTGRLTDQKIFAAWKEAVRLAHGAKVDNLARDATPYAVQCFKEQLNTRHEK